MATARDIMKGGFSAGQAKAIGGQVNSGVSAAGTTISDATALVSSVNVVTTVAASSGVLLPNVEIGDEVEVFNNTSTNAVTVYPPTTSATINQLSAGVGAQLSPYTSCKFKKFTATAWTGYLSA